MRPGRHNIHSSAHPVLANRLPRRAPRVGLKGGRHRRYSLAERLAARTERGPSCWLVTGHALPNGYVQFKTRVNGKQTSVFAHRLAYELVHGPIPAGLAVLHSCDTPRCVNPAHLSVGTQYANIHDSIHKSRRNAFGIQKLHPPQVREIRALARRGWLQKDIAARFGVARNTISQVVSGATWGHIADVAVVRLERVPHVDLPVRGDLHLGQQVRDGVRGEVA